MTLLSTKLPAARSPRRRFAREPSAVSSTMVLVVILACQLMIILDASVVITALPKIHTALHFSPTSLSWVQNAYTLTFGGLLLLGARMGDILGRRQVFIGGIAVFTAASLLGGLAQSPSWLLAARAVQGIAAAVAAPSTLALLMMTFTEAKERGRAVALYSSITGAGSSFGLVVGGLLTDALSWRWAFFINVPIGIVLVLLAPRYLPGTEGRHGRFDLTGAATSTIGMTAVVYGFVRAASDGWSDRGSVASFIIGAGLLATFVVTEMRAEQPITPMRLFSSRSRSGALLARLMIVGGMFSFFFFISQYLQGVSDFSALKAGFAFLPMTVAMFAMVQVVPRVGARFGNARLMGGGVTLALVGMAWLSRLTVSTPYFPGIALPMILLGIGIGIAFIPLTAVAIAGVEPSDSGAASGLVNVAQQVGGSLGLAILITVFGSATRSGGLDAKQQLAHGVGVALTGSTVFLALALTVILVLVRKPAAPRLVQVTAPARRDREYEPEVDLGPAA